MYWNAGWLALESQYSVLKFLLDTMAGGCNRDGLLVWLGLLGLVLVYWWPGWLG